MVQNSGNTVPFGLSLNDHEYASQISDALLSELGSTAQSAKTIMKWTGASNRTARYWLSGEKGPSGSNLLLIARHSPAVWGAILGMTGKQSAILADDIHAVEVALSKALGSVERLKRTQIKQRFPSE